MSDASFAGRLLRWFEQHGRHDLPWQHPREPYRVWVSEVMLQQTQVSTVIPYFERFMQRFPDVRTLAQASTDDVLQFWAGLGYYARGRNLHRAAQQMVEQHDGNVPQDIESVSALPGVGRSTAGAILAQAFGQRHAILDGNVRRVLARHAGIDGWPGLPKVQARLWEIAQAHLPNARLADYTQALMDLGASLCRARAPQCERCPVREDCVAHRDDRVAELPARRPTRARVQREAHVLLLVDGHDRVLVERRPPTGIWGGLWCPPVIDMDGAEDWRAHARHRGAAPDSARPLPVLHHAFTHFDLALQPLRIPCIDVVPSTIAENAEQAWIKLSDPATWPGLPAPIRKLVAQLDRQGTLDLHDPDSPPCRAPSTASSSIDRPKGSTVRPTRARSGNASTKASPRKPGSPGFSTRRG